MKPEDIERKDGKLVYRGEKFDGFNKPKPTPSHPTKKKAVLAKDGDQVKLVRYGAKGYSDFTKHKDPKRRANYRARHAAIKTKNGKPAHKNKLQASYWAWHDLW